MKFKEFLIEYSKPVKNQIDIIYQHILDNIDDGHMDMTDARLSFNIGKIMKNSAYNNLNFVVRTATKSNIRLGKDKDDKSAIVIDTKGKIPSRDKIISFLNSARYADKIKATIKTYLEKHHEFDNDDVKPATNYEKAKNTNTDFEANYEKMIQAINKKIDNYKSAKGHLTDKNAKTANIAQREITQAAMRHLFDSEVGGTFESFKSIVLKLPEAAFIKQLTTEAKTKLLSRLESYYEHKAEEFETDDDFDTDTDDDKMEND